MRSRRVVAALIVGLALVAAACSSDDESAAGSADTDVVAPEDSVFQGREMPEPAAKPDFTLTDTSGEPFDFQAETEGQITYLYFGYTFCPDICPVHLAQLSEILAEADVPPNVKVVFVTVDPQRDTPEVIRSYLDHFSTSFVGLTGTEEELEAAQIAAGVTPAIKEENPADPDKYEVGHAAQVIAYAPNGLNYTQYPFGSRQSQFAHDLPILASLRTADDIPGES